MQAKTYDTMLNDSYGYARQAREFANKLATEGDAKTSQFWHEMADKLFAVVEHGDNFRSTGK
jgi:hypothetical protein